MQHEGMVHALSEIRRVLTPNGFLIDLRPMTEERSVEIFSARETREMGLVSVLSQEADDNDAADQAMATVESNEWFMRASEEFFPIYYVWDSPKEMEEWIETEWDEFLELDEEIKQATRSAWALGDGDTRVRVQVKMLLTKWKKL